MSVYRLKDKPHGKPRALPWRAVVPREGQNPLRKQFRSREEATVWEGEQRRVERLKDIPAYRQAQELQTLKNVTVRDLIDDYINSKPNVHPNNIFTLRQFAREDICDKSVLAFTEQDANRWIAKKQNETWKPPGSKGEPKPLTPRTVRRQVNIIMQVFTHAKKFREGCASLANPFAEIEIKGATGGTRDRSLEDGELDRILEACKRCLSPNNYYIPLAIWLAIDTAMRRQEIFNLRWSDIDADKRRITIRKSKTDKVTGNAGGTIVLPVMAKHLLITLAGMRHHLSKLPNEEFEPEGGNDGFAKPDDKGQKTLIFTFPQTDERIFPMTGGAFSQAFDKVLKRAGVEDFHFHDFRREANLRFYYAGLTKEERDLMKRHANKDMDRVYFGRNPLFKAIQDKLDRFVLGGKTYKEMMDTQGEVDIPEAKQLHLAVKKWGREPHPTK
jgi:integrase